MNNHFFLDDDGSLDTCILCTVCNYSMRYSASSSSHYRDECGYLDFGKFIKEVVIPDHIDSGECGEEE